MSDQSSKSYDSLRREVAQEVEDLHLTEAQHAKILAGLRPTIHTSAVQAQRRARLRGLLALATRRWVWLGAAGFAAAGLAVVLLIPSLRPSRTSPVPDMWQASIAEHVGEILVRDAGQHERRGEKGVALRTGDRVATGSAARAVLHLGPEKLLVEVDTEATLDALVANDVRIGLMRGAVIAVVEPSLRRPNSFVVGALHAEVTVKGTVFRVSTVPERTVVSVGRGLVQVAFRGTAVDLRAGESLTIGSGFATPGKASPGELEAMKRATEGALLVDEPESASAASPVAPQVRHVPAKRRVPDAAATAAPLERARRAIQQGDCQGAETVTAALARNVGDAVRAEGLVQTADCYVARDDGTSAQRVYRLAAERYPTTAAGQNAAYELGRLARLRGNNDAAERAFAAFVARYPKSLLAAEAAFSICTARIDAQRVDKALACLAQYRRRYPAGERVAESYLLEATLLRTEKQDCAGAVRAYDAYLKHAAPYAEQARSWSAWCKNKLGASAPSTP